MDNINWSYPTLIWFGLDRISEIQKACDNLNIKNPLIVTDPGILKLNIISKVNFHLNKKASIYSEVQGNPTGSNVMNGVKFFNSGKHDGVIAVGGGSAMDVGKGIAFMAKQKRSIWDFEDIGNNWERADIKNIYPVITVPTTAGTGSENGRSGVFTKEDTNEKKIIFHPKMMPETVILDPNLTLELPPSLTAYTGMDVLAHCVEAYSSPFFHPQSQGIALEGMLIVKKYLLRSFKDGNDVEARSNMLAGSSMGSTAFAKGLGAIHSLSHPVGAIYNSHHGLTNAVFMPYVLERNREAIENKIIDVARYLDLDNYSFEGFLKWVLYLRRELKIPHSLKELINDDSKLEEMSKKALHDPSTEGNPVILKQEDCFKLYKRCYEGKLIYN